MHTLSQCVLLSVFVVFSQSAKIAAEYSQYSPNGNFPSRVCTRSRLGIWCISWANAYFFLYLWYLVSRQKTPQSIHSTALLSLFLFASFLYGFSVLTCLHFSSCWKNARSLKTHDAERYVDTFQYGVGPTAVINHGLRWFYQAELCIDLSAASSPN